MLFELAACLRICIVQRRRKKKLYVSVFWVDLGTPPVSPILVRCILMMLERRSESAKERHPLLSRGEKRGCVDVFFSRNTAL
jgi:hypothetical protein